MSRVRGKKRMEIIKKFIDGEEDPDYEVIPTVTEGKYIVRQRNGSKGSLRDKVPKDKETGGKGQKSKQKTKDDNKISDEQSDEQSDDDIDDEEIEEPKQKNKKKEPKLKQQKPKLKQQVVKQSEQVFYDPTISYQILEQLKLLGEEQRLKRTKKEQKKLVKHQIRKQLKQKEQEQESSDNEEYDYEVVEEEPKQVFRPTPLRRRVNLIK